MSARKVTSKVFDCAKTLLAGGATLKECADYLQISDVTVGRIKKAQTLEEYKQLVDSAKASVKKDVPKQTEPVESASVQKVDGFESYRINRLIALLSEQNELLKLISNKLGFIVEQLA